MNINAKPLESTLSRNSDGTATLTCVFKMPTTDVTQTEEYQKLRDKSHQLEQRIRNLMQEIDTLKSDRDKVQQNLTDTEAMMWKLMDDHAPRADYDKATQRVAELEARLSQSCYVVPPMSSSVCDCKVYQLTKISTSLNRETHAVSFTVNGHNCLLSMPASMDVKLPEAELSRPWKQWFMASPYFEGVKLFKALVVSGNTASTLGFYFKWSVNKNPHQYMPVVEAKQILLYFMNKQFRESLKQSANIGQCLCNESFKYGGSHTTTSSNENIIFEFHNAVHYGVTSILSVNFPQDEVLITVSLSGMMTTNVANLTDWPPTLKLSWDSRTAWTVAPTYVTWPTNTGPVVVYGGMATYNLNFVFPAFKPDALSSIFMLETIGSTASVTCTLLVSVEPLVPNVSVSTVTEVKVVDKVTTVDLVKKVDEIDTVVNVVPVNINTFPVWTNSERPSKGFSYDQVYTESEPVDEVEVLLQAFKYGGCNNTKGNQQMFPSVADEPYIPLKTNTVKKFSFTLLDEDQTNLKSIVATPMQTREWADSLGITLPEQYKPYYVLLVEEDFEFCDYQPAPIPDEQVAQSAVKAIANDPHTKEKHKQKLIDGIVAKSKKKEKEEQFENVIQRLRKEKVADFHTYCNTVFGTESHLNKTRPVNFSFMKRLASGLEFTVDEYGVLMAIMAKSVLVDAPEPVVVRQWGSWLKTHMQTTTYAKLCTANFSSDVVRRVTESFKYGGCNNTKGNEQIPTNFSYMYGGCNNTKGNEQTTELESHSSITLWNAETPNLVDSGFNQMYMKFQSGLPEITNLVTPFIPIERTQANGTSLNVNVVSLSRRQYRLLDDGAGGQRVDVPLVDVATFIATNVTEVFIDPEMAPLLKADTRRIPAISNPCGLLLPDIRYIPQTTVKTGCCNALLALKFLLNWYTRFPYLDAALGTDGAGISIDYNDQLHPHCVKSVAVGFGASNLFPFTTVEPQVRFYTSFAAQMTDGRSNGYFIPRNFATHPRFNQLLAVTLLILSPWPNGSFIFQDPIANTVIDYPWEWIRIRGSTDINIILPVLVDCNIPDTFNDSTSPVVTTGPVAYGGLLADDDLTAFYGNYDDNANPVPLLNYLKTWVGNLQKQDFIDWLYLQPWFNLEELDFALHLEAQACTWDEPISVGGVNLPLRRTFAPVMATGAPSFYAAQAPPYIVWGHLPQYESGYMNLLATGLAPLSGTEPALEPDWCTYLSYSYWSRLGISHFFHASAYLAVARYGVDSLAFQTIRATAFTALQRKLVVRKNKWKGQLAGQYRMLYNKLSCCKSPVIPWNDAVLGPISWTPFDVWQIRYDSTRTIPGTQLLHPMVNNGFYLVHCQHVHPFGSLPGPWQKQVIWKGQATPARGLLGPWLPVDYNIDGSLGSGAKWFDTQFCEYMFKNGWICTVGGHALRANLALASRYVNYPISPGLLWSGVLRMSPGVNVATELDYLLLPIVYNFAGDVIAPNSYSDNANANNAAMYLLSKENAKGLAGWKTILYSKEGSTYTETLDTGDLGAEIDWNTNEDHIAVKNQTETSVSSN